MTELLEKIFNLLERNTGPGDPVDIVCLLSPLLS
jgi:hypothetical protein